MPLAGALIWRPPDQRMLTPLCPAPFFWPVPGLASSPEVISRPSTSVITARWRSSGDKTAPTSGGVLLPPTNAAPVPFDRQRLRMVPSGCVTSSRRLIPVAATVWAEATGRNGNSAAEEAAPIPAARRKSRRDHWRSAVALGASKTEVPEVLFMGQPSGSTYRRDRERKLHFPNIENADLFVNALSAPRG